MLEREVTEAGVWDMKLRRQKVGRIAKSVDEGWMRLRSC